MTIYLNEFLNLLWLQDFSFSDTDKKTLAELLLWPILHESSRHAGIGKPVRSGRQVVRRDITTAPTAEAAAAGDREDVPWPILRFMGRTPKLIDGVWLIAAYVTYKDNNSSTGNETHLLKV